MERDVNVRLKLVSARLQKHQLRRAPEKRFCLFSDKKENNSENNANSWILKWETGTILERFEKPNQITNLIIIKKVRI